MFVRTRTSKAIAAALLVVLGVGAGKAATPAGTDGRAPGVAPVAVAPTRVTPAQPGPRTDIGARVEPDDQVIPDDLIVQGSTCIGLDCVDGESFGTDTIRLKENNTRIKFDDTSTSTGFASDDWQLTANDQPTGGANKFSIENITLSTVPFTISGTAPTNSLFVSGAGDLGVRTSSPVLDLHMTTGDTPGVRFEQTNGSGFTAQTWDIGANEANFFVRDVTGGSRLSLRIRPGAPTSSLDINAEGNVGLGTASPDAWIDIERSSPAATPVPALRVVNTTTDYPSGQNDRFTVDSAGNVTARGTISQLSSRTSKENFARNDHKLVLAKLEKLAIPSWNYRGGSSDDRHLGPVAEDFRESFGLGKDGRFVAPGDVAGVALLSAQALQSELHERDAHIAALEARLAALEARLARVAE